MLITPFNAATHPPIQQTPPIILRHYMYRESVDQEFDVKTDGRDICLMVSREQLKKYIY